MLCGTQLLLYVNKFVDAFFCIVYLLLFSFSFPNSVFPYVYEFLTSTSFSSLFIVVIQYHDRKHVFHIVPHSTDVGVWVRLGGVEKPFYRRKTLLVVGETGTQVLFISLSLHHYLPLHLTFSIHLPFHSYHPLYIVFANW